MPIDGEPCVHCDKPIRRIEVWDKAADGISYPGEGWRCGGGCPAPTGRSDLEPTED